MNEQDRKIEELTLVVALLLKDKTLEPQTQLELDAVRAVGDRALRSKDKP